MYCGVTNLILVAMFTLNVGSMSAKIWGESPLIGTKSNLERHSDPSVAGQPATASDLRTDLELPIQYRKVPRGLGDRNRTTVIHRDVTWGETGDDERSALEEGFDIANLRSEEVSISPRSEQTSSDAPSLSPLLRRGLKSGELEIGSFKSVILNGGVDDCKLMGETMLNDLGVSARKIMTIADSGQISIARICANNGSIILSCRNGKITISPRRSRPDDKCGSLS